MKNHATTSPRNRHGITHNGIHYKCEYYGVKTATYKCTNVWSHQNRCWMRKSGYRRGKSNEFEPCPGMLRFDVIRKQYFLHVQHSCQESKFEKVDNADTRATVDDEFDGTQAQYNHKNLSPPALKCPSRRIAISIAKENGSFSELPVGCLRPNSSTIQIAKSMQKMDEFSDTQSNSEDRNDNELLLRGVPLEQSQTDDYHVHKQLEEVKKLTRNLPSANELRQICNKQELLEEITQLREEVTTLNQLVVGLRKEIKQKDEIFREMSASLDKKNKCINQQYSAISDMTALLNVISEVPLEKSNTVSTSWKSQIRNKDITLSDSNEVISMNPTVSPPSATKSTPKKSQKSKNIDDVMSTKTNENDCSLSPARKKSNTPLSSAKNTTSIKFQSKQDRPLNTNRKASFISSKQNHPNEFSPSVENAMLDEHRITHSNSKDKDISLSSCEKHSNSNHPRQYTVTIKYNEKHSSRKNINSSFSDDNGLLLSSTPMHPKISPHSVKNTTSKESSMVVKSSNSGDNPSLLHSTPKNPNKTSLSTKKNNLMKSNQELNSNEDTHTKSNKKSEHSKKHDMTDNDTRITNGDVNFFTTLEMRKIPSKKSLTPKSSKILQEQGWKCMEGSQPYNQVYVPPDIATNSDASLGMRYFTSNNVVHEAIKCGHLDASFDLNQPSYDTSFSCGENRAEMASLKTIVDDTYECNYALDDSKLYGSAKIITLATAEWTLQLTSDFMQEDQESVKFVGMFFTPLWDCLKAQGSHRKLNWRYQICKKPFKICNWCYVPPCSLLGANGVEGVDFFTSEEEVVLRILEEIATLDELSSALSKHASSYSELRSVLSHAVKYNLKYKEARSGKSPITRTRRSVTGRTKWSETLESRNSISNKVEKRKTLSANSMHKASPTKKQKISEQNNERLSSSSNNDARTQNDDMNLPSLLAFF